MTVTWLGGVFLASLLGSLHCAGMCGGLTCFVAGRGGARALVAYHLGRLASYAAVGAVAGWSGRVLDLGGRAAGLGRVGTFLFLTVVVLGSLALLLRGFGIGTSLRSPASPLGRLFTRLGRFLQTVPPGRRALGLGLLTVLLPCGWLYLFAASAAATADPVLGAAAMVAFWAGGLPALLGLGLVTARWTPALRRRLPAAAGALLLVAGLTSLAPRLAPPSFTAAQAAGDAGCAATAEPER